MSRSLPARQTRPKSARVWGNALPAQRNYHLTLAIDNLNGFPSNTLRLRWNLPPTRYTHPVGTLYVIGTPIGNLEDLTFRAARILSEVPLVAAEDTRVTRRLLNHLSATPRIISCNEHNWQHRLAAVLDALAAGDVAYATDAGAPSVSDPGAGLAVAVAAAGFDVVAIPGVSAVTAALSVAGFSADRFLFLGFLPRRRSERTSRLDDAAASQNTVVVFEAPHRLAATLADIRDAMGDPSLAVCRELTKLYEEVWRGTASDALDHFANPRGEFTIVIGVNPAEPQAEGEPTLAVEAARQALAERRATGTRGRDAIAEVVAATGLPRRTVYALWIETGKG